MPRTTLFCALLVTFAMFAPIFCVPPMEPILKEQLFLTHTQTSLLFSTPLLMLVAIAIPAGRIADRIGVKKATGFGLIIMAIGAIMRGTATAYPDLLVFTFVYGFGFGWTLPNMPKLVATFVHRDRAHIAMGITNLGIPLGIALGLALTMPVIWPVTNTYQGVFFIWSIPVVIAAILWWILVKEPRRRSADFQESSVNTAALRTVISNKNLLLIAALMFLHLFFVYNWTGWAPVLMMSKGVSPVWAGFITSVAHWAYIPAFFLMPKLSYKLGLRKPFLWLPSIILALASWGATKVSINASWFLMALVGIANGTRFVTLLSLPVEMMHKKDVGTASGIMLAIGYAGAVIGPLVGGRVFDITQNLDLSFMILIVLSLASTIIALRIHETGLGRRM
ncbi:CynX/NimT family MFS transporter [Chloroflexota bacterium]